jgi:hypothetical protein
VKDCVRCGAEVDDSASVCEHCGYRFGHLPSPESAEASPVGRHSAPTAPRRPDGTAPLTIAYILIGFGLLLILVGIFSSSGDYSQNAPFKLVIVGSGWALTNTGLVLWVGGYVARAISFLPTKG